MNWFSNPFRTAPTFVPNNSGAQALQTGAQAAAPAPPARAPATTTKARPTGNWFQRSAVHEFFRKNYVSTTTQGWFWSRTTTKQPSRTRHNPVPPETARILKLPEGLGFKPVTGNIDTPKPLALPSATNQTLVDNINHITAINTEWGTRASADTHNALYGILADLSTNPDGTSKLQKIELNSLAVAMITATRLRQADLPEGLTQTQKDERISMADAIAGLQSLRNMNIIDSILSSANNPNPALDPSKNHADAHPAKPEEAKIARAQAFAWEIAQELAKKPNGYEILKKITLPRCTQARDELRNDYPEFCDNGVKEKFFNDRYAHIIKRITTEEDTLARNYLRAMSEKKRESALPHASRVDNIVEPKIFACDPDTLRQHRNAKPNIKDRTLLDKGLDGIEDQLQKCRRLRIENIPNNAAIKWIITPDQDPFSIDSNQPNRAAVQRHQEKYIVPKIVAECGLDPQVQDHQTPGNEKHPSAWAATAIANGVYTDRVVDEHGNPTLYAQKVAHIQRAAKWANRAVEEGKTATTKKERVLKVLRRVRNLFRPMHNKSPFGVLRSVKNPTHRHLNQGQANLFSVTGGGTLGESRAIAKAMVITAAKLREKAGLPAFDALDQQRVTPRLRGDELRDTITQIAAIEQAWQEVSNLWRQGHGDTLDVEGAPTRFDNRVENLANLCLDRVGNGVGQDDPALIAARNLMKEKKGVTVDDLVLWASDAEGNAPDPRPGNPVPPYITRDNMRVNNPWYEWAKEMKRGYGELAYVQTDVAFQNKRELGNVIGKVIEQQELGSGLTLSEGGAYGVSTKGITGHLSKWISACSVALRLDARLARSKRAFVDFGVGAHGSELNLGTEKGLHGYLGAGVQAGPVINTGNPKYNINLSGKGEGGYAYNNTKKEGISCRFDRTVHGFLDDPVNGKKMAEVARQLVEGPVSAEARTDVNRYASGEPACPLKDLYQRFGDISTSLIEENEVSHTGSFTLGASALAQCGAVRVGTAVEGSPKYTHQTGNRTETGGSLNISQNSSGSEWGVNVGLTAGSMRHLNPPPAPGDFAAVLTNLGLPMVDLFSVQASLLRRGITTLNTIINKDDLNHKLSNRVIVYQNAKAFKESILTEANRYEYNTTKTARYATNHAYRIVDEKGREIFNGARLPDQISSPDDPRNIRIKNKDAELLNTVARVLEEQDQSKVFKEYLELTPLAVERSNTIRALMADYNALGDNESAKKCALYLQSILDDDQSWERTYLVISERASEQTKISSAPAVVLERTSMLTARVIDTGY